MGVSADIIVAEATAPGRAALAIVRLSGPGAGEAACRMLVPRSPRWRRSGRLPERRIALCEARDPLTLQPLDEVTAIYYRAPRSYTGEDMVEIICHGGRATAQGLVEAARRAGARLAAPGEFTQRAFLNGKMDLAQAEAVADLIAARTEAARRAALRQLEGGLSAGVGTLRTRLLDAAAEIEARLDFPEEGIEPADTERLARDLEAAAETIAQLLEQGRRGRFLRDGARVAIAGRPNVGKSSLLNAILGRERALVSPHPGTTRDSIEATVDIRGLEVTFIDTAGVRPGGDEIEQLGIGRARSEIARADAVLAVLDASAPLQDEDLVVFDLLAGRPAALVLNKTDQPIRLDAGVIVAARPTLAALPLVFTSALERRGLPELEAVVLELLDASPALLSGGVILTNARHIEALERAQTALKRAQRCLVNAEPAELTMIDLREAIVTLGEITGESLNEEILDRIFSRFCIGK
ncbi:MAG: tRNA uridine-5-carboxymethylaminomethyl(34) synthesis GTPase MnmE [Candidatus Sumerlaeia bacterium]